MARVLVVEDSPEKLRHVLVALKQVPGCGGETFDVAHDALEAKRRLKEHTYDLMILDIALPDRPEDLPTQEGGIRLLEEIVERDVYHHPREIVGLTAFPEVRDRAASKFAEDLALVLQYDPGSEAWSEQLKRKLRQIVVASRTTEPAANGCELCIVVALHDPELKAVLGLPWQWAIKEVDNDGSIYYEGRYSRGDGSRLVYAAAAPRMGMTAAAVLTTKMIGTFRPRYVAMAGITAGIKGCCEIGDIIAADPSWDYGSGKHHLESGKAIFSPAPHQLGLNCFVRGRLQLMAEDASEFAKIRHVWQGPAPNASLRMHIGPVASGAAVLQDPTIAAGVKQQHRKLLGVEMETYGVFAAVDEAPYPQPKAFSLKSVCDFADADKNDDFQSYASYTSANAVRLFAEKYL